MPSNVDAAETKLLTVRLKSHSVAEDTRVLGVIPVTDPSEQEPSRRNSSLSLSLSRRLSCHQKDVAWLLKNTQGACFSVARLWVLEAIWRKLQSVVEHCGIAFSTDATTAAALDGASFRTKRCEQCRGTKSNNTSLHALSRSRLNDSLFNEARVAVTFVTPP